TKLQEMVKKDHRLSLLSLRENRGSAGGYKAGLEKIVKEIPCDYILFLDDDNLPPKGFLEKLRGLTLYFHDFPSPYALICYRPIFPISTEYILEGCDFSYKYNAFASNNLLKNFLKKTQKIFRFLFKKRTSAISQSSFSPLRRIDMAPYGGFFISRDFLSLIGYPREDFILYLDDLEYTFRLTDQGGYIFLCSEIPIQDLDSSHDTKSKTYWILQPDLSEFKLYYYLRNATYWYSHTFKTNCFLYTINMFLWFLRLFLSGIFHPLILFRRLPLILRAIRDGQQGHLGKTF
ncbi:MAG: glycosyltransferase, partial [Brevinematales bacterium]